MNNLTFTGKVTAILPYQQGVSKNGNQWVKATFIVEETEQQYPQRAVFSMMGQQRIQDANIQLNEIVTVHFNLGAHQNPNNPAQWFSDINAWKVERPQMQMQQPAQQPQGFAQPQYAPQPQTDAPRQQPDQLPFGR